MPYEIRREGDDRYCVYKQGTDEKVACHDTSEEARRHMAALYANVDKSFGSEPLVFYGGEVKALGNGKVGGYLILFSGPSDPDLQGDYFTKSTDFLVETGETRPILYRHGVHPQIKSKKLGRATVTIDDLGVFVEGELDMRDRYIQAIYGMVEKGQLGWSSGSMSHLVLRKPANGKKSMELLSWPIGEASLTPVPVEARTQAVALKSLGAGEELDFDKVIKSLDQEEYDHEFLIDGVPLIKRYGEAVSPNSLTDGSQRSQSAAHAVKEFSTIAKILVNQVNCHKSLLVTRAEHRFLKHNRDIDQPTIAETDAVIAVVDEIVSALQSVKEPLVGIRQIGERSKAEQKAMDEKAKFQLWNYYRISGYKPEELNDV